MVLSLDFRVLTDVMEGHLSTLCRSSWGKELTTCTAHDYCRLFLITSLIKIYLGHKSLMRCHMRLKT